MGTHRRLRANGAVSQDRTTFARNHDFSLLSIVRSAKSLAGSFRYTQLEKRTLTLTLKVQSCVTRSVEAEVFFQDQLVAGVGFPDDRGSGDGVIGPTGEFRAKDLGRRLRVRDAMHQSLKLR